jgi:hypothetical protein
MAMAVLIAAKTDNHQMIGAQSRGQHHELGHETDKRRDAGQTKQTDCSG